MELSIDSKGYVAGDSGASLFSLEEISDELQFLILDSSEAFRPAYTGDFLFSIDVLTPQRPALFRAGPSCSLLVQ